MEYWLYVFTLFSAVIFVDILHCTELTFELPDSARECFHETIKKNTSVTLEFQASFYFL